MVGSMANPRLRSLLWWRWWAKKDWAIAAVGFTVVAFALTLLSNSWSDEPDSEISRPFHPINASDLVELTLLQNAKARGARYRRSLLKALKEFQKNKEGGMFISSCFIHCQAWMTETWHAPTSPRINNKGLAKSLHKDFATRMEPSKCLFPEEIIKNINTPVFLVNPAYDFWQVSEVRC